MVYGVFCKALAAVVLIVAFSRGTFQIREERDDCSSIENVFICDVSWRGFLFLVVV